MTFRWLKVHEGMCQGSVQSCHLTICWSQFFWELLKVLTSDTSVPGDVPVLTRLHLHPVIHQCCRLKIASKQILHTCCTRDSSQATQRCTGQTDAQKTHQEAHRETRHPVEKRRKVGGSWRLTEWPARRKKGGVPVATGRDEMAEAHMGKVHPKLGLLGSLITETCLAFLQTAVRLTEPTTATAGR